MWYDTHLRHPSCTTTPKLLRWRRKFGTLCSGATCRTIERVNGNTWIIKAWCWRSRMAQLQCGLYSRSVSTRPFNSAEHKELTIKQWGGAWVGIIILRCESVTVHFALLSLETPSLIRSNSQVLTNYNMYSMPSFGLSINCFKAFNQDPFTKWIYPATNKAMNLITAIHNSRTALAGRLLSLPCPLSNSIGTATLACTTCD